MRKRVTLTYQAATNGLTSKRDLDPYAMVYREGAWLVVGWCHLRKEIRSFRVDRIREAVMAPKPKSPDFERPADFDVKAYATRSPWTFTTEPPEEVQLVLSARGGRGRERGLRPDRGEAPRERSHVHHVRLHEPRVRGEQGPRREGRDPRDARRPPEARGSLAELDAIADDVSGSRRGDRCRVTSRSGCAACCTSCRTSRSTPRACRSTSWRRRSAPIATSCSPISICSRRSARPTAIRANICWSPSTRAACSSISRTG